MHAHLFIVKDSKKAEKVMEQISGVPSSKYLKYDINKISGVRKLSQMTKLSSTEKRIILINNFDNASHEAMNAFLKLLEEPKSEITYFLTAQKQGSLLPTVLSRLNIIKIKEEISTDMQKSDSFINKTFSEKIIFIDSIKKREEAIQFLDDLVYSCHQKLLKQKINNKKSISRIINCAIKSRNAIDKNGNINLHLSNFVLLIEEKHF